MDFLPPSLAFIEGLGGPEMVLILVIVLVLFGGEKLPDFARGLGKSIREFKKAASGVEEEFKRALEEDEHKKSAPPPPPTAFPPYPPVAQQIEAAATEPLTLETPPATEPATTPSATLGSTDAHVILSAAPVAPVTPGAPTPSPVPPPASKPEPSAESYAPRSADLLP